MLLVFTTNANNSDEIKKELVLASQSRLIVIPLRVEDVKPDDAFAYELATRHWIDFFHDWEAAMERLVRRIVSVVPRSQPIADTPVPQPAPPADEKDPVSPWQPEEKPSRGANAPEVLTPDPPLATPTAPTPAAPLPIVPETDAVPATPGVLTVEEARAMGNVALAGRKFAEVYDWYLREDLPGSTATASAAEAAPATATVVTLEEALGNGDNALDRKDYAEAYKWYRKAADQGHAQPCDGTKRQRIRASDWRNRIFASCGSTSGDSLYTQ